MKTVLAFGDSLTWGAVPGTQERHEFDVRWPNVLEEALKGKIRVVENGVNGRTTTRDDPFASYRNGAEALPYLLEAHSPLDLVIIMLGTNDLNYCYGGRAFEAMIGMDRLVEIVQHHTYPRATAAPKVLLVAPPHLRAPRSDPDYVEYFGGAIDESKLLAGLYERVAQERGCAVMNAAKISKVSPIDGCHLNEKNTRAIGTSLGPIVQDLLDL